MSEGDNPTFAVTAELSGPVPELKYVSTRFSPKLVTTKSGSLLALNGKLASRLANSARDGTEPVDTVCRMLKFVPVVLLMTKA